VRRGESKDTSEEPKCKKCGQIDRIFRILGGEVREGGQRGQTGHVFSCPEWQGHWEAVKFEIVNKDHALINQNNIPTSIDTAPMPASANLRPTPQPLLPQLICCANIVKPWVARDDVEGTVGMAISSERSPFPAKSCESTCESGGPSCESPLQNL